MLEEVAGILGNKLSYGHDYTSPLIGSDVPHEERGREALITGSIDALASEGSVVSVIDDHGNGRIAVHDDHDIKT